MEKLTSKLRLFLTKQPPGESPKHSTCLLWLIRKNCQELYSIFCPDTLIQHCDTVRGLEGGVPAFFSIMRFWGRGIFFWFNYALYSQLQVVHTFVQHCTTCFFYNKQLYNVQPNICIINIFHRD